MRFFCSCVTWNPQQATGSNIADMESGGWVSPHGAPFAGGPQLTLLIRMSVPCFYRTTTSASNQVTSRNSRRCSQEKSGSASRCFLWSSDSCREGFKGNKKGKALVNDFEREGSMLVSEADRKQRMVLKWTCLSSIRSMNFGKGPTCLPVSQNPSISQLHFT